MKRSDISGLPAHARAEVERQLAGKPAPTPDTRVQIVRAQDDMNGTERDYARHLYCLGRARQISSFSFQGLKLILAERCTYTPDFFVEMPDGTKECHEIKGRKGTRFYAKDDAIVKIKVAAVLFPQYKFSIRWPDGKGGWNKKEFSGVRPNPKEAPSGEGQ